MSLEVETTKKKKAKVESAGKKKMTSKVKAQALELETSGLSLSGGGRGGPHPQFLKLVKAFEVPPDLKTMRGRKDTDKVSVALIAAAKAILYPNPFAPRAVLEQLAEYAEGKNLEGFIVTAKRMLDMRKVSTTGWEYMMKRKTLEEMQEVFDNPDLDDIVKWFASFFADLLPEYVAFVEDEGPRKTKQTTKVKVGNLTYKLQKNDKKAGTKACIIDSRDCLIMKPDQQDDLRMIGMIVESCQLILLDPYGDEDVKNGKFIALSRFEPTGSEIIEDVTHKMLQSLSDYVGVRRVQNAMTKGEKQIRAEADVRIANLTKKLKKLKAGK